MFQITDEEAKELVSQNVIPHKKYLGGSLPYAFTEQGVAMLSSVLNSERAITKVFSNIDGDHFRQISRHIQAKFEEKGERLITDDMYILFKQDACKI